MTSGPAILFANAGASLAYDSQLSFFARTANAVARATGTPKAFVLCCVGVLIWAGTGPAFHFSDTWQLVINTGTTIITFLMVFLI